MVWPGNAAVVVSIAWVARNGWQGQRVLDDRTVSAINGALEEDFQIKRPMKLKALKGHYSQGQNVHGRGLELNELEREAIISDSPQCKEVIVPIFNGQDLNTMPKLAPYRWVIYFRDWSEERAREYGAAFRRVESMVKPFRDGLTGQIHQDCFWKFWDIRPRLVREVEMHEYVLASAIVTKYVIFRRVPSRNIYTTKTNLFFFYDWSRFSVLAVNHPSRMGILEVRHAGRIDIELLDVICDGNVANANSDNDNEKLESLGERYHAHRELLMAENPSASPSSTIASTISRT